MSSETPFRLGPAFPERAARGTADKLRAWQAEAVDHYWSRPSASTGTPDGTGPRDYLVAATPGAGKTTFALRLASELIAKGVIERITVVTPTDHLKRQWADAAHRVGLTLDPGFRNAHGRPTRHSRHFHGLAVTYAQVALRPVLHRNITEGHRTLVILDEVHHGGDALSWGDGIREAFETATRRVSLTGTPFRSDTAPIPFVEYHPGPDGVRTSKPDYSYGYGRALADGVVRPVIFLAYAGRMRWRTRTGDEMEARLGEGDTKDVTAQAWRTALDPEGEWVPQVLRAANRRLTEVRHHVPDAAGLVIATDKATARAYASILEQQTGERAVVVLSDEKEASERIASFAAATSRWMVAVRMVSEGVDIPRLGVGVYATSASTPLFFAQAVGRFVRTRRRGETASIFVPSVPQLMQLAGELERERDHALDRAPADGLEEILLDDDSVAKANESERASADADLFDFAPIASDANFDRVLYDGSEFGFAAGVGTPEELDFIGIPGLLEPDQVRELLQQRQARQARRSRQRGAPVSQPLYRTLKEQRALLNGLVASRARRTGEPHAHIHAELRRSVGGPPVAQASVAQLQARIDLLRKQS
ncbi:MAG: DEAD/DEAH box helicase [Cryobacterium sp.]|nr:DEAD/DEAH box helicase [Cryobacterium sp.]